MTTLCLADYSEPVKLETHPRTVIRDTLKDYCAMKPCLSDRQVEIVIEVGMQRRDRYGDSPAKAIEAGKAAANRLVQLMREESKPRPDPPRAA